MNRSLQSGKNGSDESALTDLQILFFSFSSDDTRDRGSRPRQSSVGRNRLKGFRIYRIHSSSPLPSPPLHPWPARVSARVFRCCIKLDGCTDMRVYACVCVIYVCVSPRSRVRVGGNSGARKPKRERERERERGRGEGRKSGMRVEGGREDDTYFEDYQSLVTCKGSNYPGADWAPFAAPTARLVHPRWWRRLRSPRNPCLYPTPHQPLSFSRKPPFSL